MLNARTTTLIARPGKMARYGAVSRLRRPSPLSIPPQVGVGGGVPRPRKLRAASMTMALPSQTVAMTRIGAKTFGSTWRRTIRAGDAPEASAASTNVGCLMASLHPDGQATLVEIEGVGIARGQHGGQQGHGDQSTDDRGAGRSQRLAANEDHHGPPHTTAGARRQAGLRSPRVW